ncbi:hypothetical protein ACP70R_037017 [Stipagrostis hirtigluma subsp. patula]
MALELSIYSAAPRGSDASPHSIPPRPLPHATNDMASYSSGSKRPLEMVVYDPDAAAAETKRARKDEAVGGAPVPHAAGATVLDVAPIRAVPMPVVPRRLRLTAPRPPPGPPPAAREEPPCLRKHFLLGLKLRADLPVHFIDDKRITDTDLKGHQNRLRIPSEGATRRLRAIMTPTERDAANLLHDPPPKPRPKKKTQEPQSGAAAAEGQPQQGKKIKKPKKQGKRHGGLRVNLVHLTAGAKELMLSRWESSRGTIVKGEGYIDFIRRCCFQEKDEVEIWAFLQRRFRLFGVTMCDESCLHVLLVKKDGKHECRYCAQPSDVK